MHWICKFCTFSSANQRSIIKHYKLKHGHYSRSCPLPCVYSDCVCSFKTQVALRNHLLKHGPLANGSQSDFVAHGSLSDVVTHLLQCDLCNFSEPCHLKQYFVHLGGHLKKETLKCPFQLCQFKSNVYSKFTAHKSRYHCSSGLKDLRAELICDYSPSTATSEEHADIPNSLEDERMTLIEEMKKKPDWKRVDSLMGSTFALQRKEIVDGEPPLSEVADRWPALISERQTAAEFMRLVSVDLHNSFLDGLDKYLLRLMELYRVRDSSITKLHSLLQSLDFEASHQKGRSVALLGLPYYLREDPSNFIKICGATDSEEVTMKGVAVGLLIVTEESGSEEEVLPKDILNVAVILEEHIVLHELRDVPNAFAVLMGLFL